uniref:Transposable element P transposase-like RNase H C-terminal domain-containing protein n=1 Tax=Photinus pyralis TaxID=7054 RepID=A0A1Y1NHZ1_PHOPY
MQFFCNKRQKFVYNPSLKNLAHAIRAFMYICKILLENKKFAFVATRAFNQDPIENLFGYIRSHNYRNINPNASHFVASMKSLIVNNFLATHSPSSNCEEDLNSGGLDNLKSFITGIPSQSLVHTPNLYNQKIEVPEHISLHTKTKLHRSIITYISGYVGRLLIKKFKVCDTCQRNLQISDTNFDHDIILARKYQNCKLVIPGSYLNVMVSNCLNSLFYWIPRIAYVKDISSVLSFLLRKNFSFSPFNCSEHNVGDAFVSLIVRCCLYWWCRSLNKVAKGKDAKFVSFLAKKPPAHLIDPVKVAAHKKYLMKKKRNRVT